LAYRQEDYKRIISIQNDMPGKRRERKNRERFSGISMILLIVLLIAAAASIFILYKYF